MLSARSSELPEDTPETEVRSDCSDVRRLEWLQWSKVQATIHVHLRVSGDRRSRPGFPHVTTSDSARLAEQSPICNCDAARLDLDPSSVEGELLLHLPDRLGEPNPFLSRVIIATAPDGVREFPIRNACGKGLCKQLAAA